MKKYLSFAAFALMLAAGVFTLAACGGDDDESQAVPTSVAEAKSMFQEF